MPSKTTRGAYIIRLQISVYDLLVVNVQASCGDVNSNRQDSIKVNQPPSALKVWAMIDPRGDGAEEVAAIAVLLDQVHLPVRKTLTRGMLMLEQQICKFN